MKIDFSKLMENDSHSRTDWRYNFLMNVMSDHTHDANNWKKTFGADITQPPVMLDVVVSINGVEMPFDKWIERLESSYTQMLEEHAKKMMSESFNKLTETLYKLEREADMALSDSIIASEKNKYTSITFVLNQLAGMSFPDKGEAYEFMKKSLPPVDGG